MFCIYRSMPRLAVCLALTILLAATGCRSTHSRKASPAVQSFAPAQNIMPRELSKVVLPPYTIEPPDMLVIDEVYLVPPPSYTLRPNDTLSVIVQRTASDPLRPGDVLIIEVEGFPERLRPGDVLMVRADGLPQDAPLQGQFQVEGDGQLRLVVPRVEEVVEIGPDGRESVRREIVGMRDYGAVMVEGLSIEEAEEAVTKKLGETWKETAVWAALAQTTARPIEGPYRVLPRGDIYLGLPYGHVAVAGMTIDEAKEAIRSSVNEILDEPIVSVTLDTFAATPVDGYYTIQLDGTLDLNSPSGESQPGYEGPAVGWGAGTGLRPQQGAPPQDIGVPAAAPGEPPGAGPVQRALAGGADVAPAGPSGAGSGRIFVEPIDVVGMRIDGARERIRERLADHFTHFDVSVTLAGIAGRQQVMGEHLVQPDGRVTLGDYGHVPVVGLTIQGAKKRIEEHLGQFFQHPKVAVDVYAYNSKKYYVITQGAGMGDGVTTFPITGNETVLDAISQMNGLTQVSSKRIWIARPTPDPEQVQVLPVNWEAITAQASPATNYQILPGDRIFIAEDSLIAFDNNLAKFTAPLRQIMEFAVYGTGVVTRFSGPVLRGGGARGSGFYSGIY